MRICPQCALQYPDDAERCFADGSALEEAPDPWLGRVLLGRYRIEEKLGAGGMATVYRASHALVDRLVAIKILNENLTKDPKLRERFRREARNASAIQHPHVIDIHDYGETEQDVPFLVMELLEGEPLSARIARGALSPPEAARIGLQIARGLARAHDLDVVHRDLKPDNVFLARCEEGEERAKILDFGIARSMHDERLTRAGELFGTPQYMAPERIADADAGPSADLYSLGVILYEMLAGAPPFRGEALTALLLAHLNQSPEPLSRHVRGVPAELERLVMRLLAKKPEERPVDAHEVARELERFAPAEARRALPELHLDPRRRKTSIAPTLPPTSLEDWGKRLTIFQQMVDRLQRQGSGQDLATRIAELQTLLERMRRLRAEALGEQRKLEALEMEAREMRSRLGHAVHALGEDLSRARTAVRQAEQAEREAANRLRSARALHEGAVTEVERLGAMETLQEPREPLPDALRAWAAAHEAWIRAVRGTEEAANRRNEAEERVGDLEFQIAALRRRLEQVERDSEHRRDAAERAVQQKGEQVDRLERKLMAGAASLAGALRKHRELGDLFGALERRGASN